MGLGQRVQGQKESCSFLPYLGIKGKSRIKRNLTICIFNLLLVLQLLVELPYCNPLRSRGLVSMADEISAGDAFIYASITGSFPPGTSLETMIEAGIYGFASKNIQKAMPTATEVASGVYHRANLLENTDPPQTPSANHISSGGWPKTEASLGPTPSRRETAATAPKVAAVAPRRVLTPTDKGYQTDKATAVYHLYFDKRGADREGKIRGRVELFSGKRYSIWLTDLDGNPVQVASGHRLGFRVGDTSGSRIHYIRPHNSESSALVVEQRSIAQNPKGETGLQRKLLIFEVKETPEEIKRLFHRGFLASIEPTLLPLDSHPLTDCRLPPLDQRTHTLRSSLVKTAFWGAFLSAFFLIAPTELEKGTIEGVFKQTSESLQKPPVQALVHETDPAVPSGKGNKAQSSLVSKSPFAEARLYSAPDSTGEPWLKVQKDTSVKVHSKTKDGWLLVEITTSAGQTARGYVRKEAAFPAINDATLPLLQTPRTYATQLYSKQTGAVVQEFRTNADLVFYSSPHTKEAASTSIPKNSILKPLGRYGNDWYLVSVQVTTGKDAGKVGVGYLQKTKGTALIEDSSLPALKKEQMFPSGFLKSQNVPPAP